MSTVKTNVFTVVAQASQGNFMEKAVWDLVSDDEEDVNMQKEGSLSKPYHFPSCRNPTGMGRVASN